MWLWFALSLALAGDAIELQLVRVGSPGGSPPSLSVLTHTEGTLDVSVQCGAKRFTKSAAIAPGGKVEVPLSGLPQGRTACQGQLDLVDATGSAGSMPLNFEVSVVPALALEFLDLSLSAREVEVRPNQPVRDVRIEVIGEGGRVIGGAPLSGVMSDEATIRRAWQADGEVIQVKVYVTTEHGASAVMELTPWSYAIPHEDVVFATASDVIAAAETPKLEASWTELERALAKYGAIMEVQLFVVGHTDTMGTTAYNQGLSERRAKSIASWFVQRGFAGSVWYQGLGEGALAVPTPDETDEPANRRAGYILAASPPPPAEGHAPTGWKRLR